MGVLSDIKAMADVQRIKNGGTANLSISQIVCLIVNLQDAKKNLPKQQFEAVYFTFKQFRKQKEKMELTIEGYYRVASGIILLFNQIAPYEKYSGMNQIETRLLLKEIQK